jgi:serine kinase of HPr protein (carbohydrate metabolism regulator)
MKVREIVDKFDLKVLTAPDRLDVEVSGGYTSDLLSDVMANSRPGNIWITLQTHQNIVAVAKLKSLAAIVLVNNRTPDPETLKSAEEENVPLLSSGDPAFKISAKLYARLEIKD